MKYAPLFLIAAWLATIVALVIVAAQRDAARRALLFTAADDAVLDHGEPALFRALLTVQANGHPEDLAPLKALYALVQRLCQARLGMPK